LSSGHAEGYSVVRLYLLRISVSIDALMVGSARVARLSTHDSRILELPESRRKTEPESVTLLVVAAPTRRDSRRAPRTQARARSKLGGEARFDSCTSCYISLPNIPGWSHSSFTSWEQLHVVLIIPIIQRYHHSILSSSPTHYAFHYSSSFIHQRPLHTQIISMRSSAQKHSRASVQQASSDPSPCQSKPYQWSSRDACHRHLES
jgi:hypothetical protein